LDQEPSQPSEGQIPARRTLRRDTLSFCDSSAILARWLTNPTSRDFELHELAVIIAVISSSPQE
jgi:hypothetical protein